VSAAAAEHRQIAVGVSCHSNFLRPMTASLMEVIATAVPQSRTQQLWQAGITDVGRRLIATGQVRRQNAGPRP